MSESGTRCTRIGMTNAEIREWWDGMQSYPDTCGIRSVEFVLQLYQGKDYDEHLLVRQATAYGIRKEGKGIRFQDVSTLLEMHGIPVHVWPKADVLSLARVLLTGGVAIVGVDSGELDPWITDWLSDAIGWDGTDHGVVVVGIETRDPDDVRIIYSDPGTGRGASSRPLRQFMDAWADGDNLMVSVAIARPGFKSVRHDEARFAPMVDLTRFLHRMARGEL